MKFINVESSNIEAIGYEYEDEILYIKYLNGSVYKFYKVPKQIYEEFLSAPSKGQFMNSRIKGAFSYVKMTTLP